jgi:hypothetical protein
MTRWETTGEGVRKLRTHSGIVHHVNMVPKAIGDGEYTERGRSLCGLRLRRAHGAWVPLDSALTCLHCIGEAL